MDGVEEFAHRFALGCSGDIDQVVAFVFVHEGGCFEEAWFLPFWDGEKAVFVRVDELAGLDLGFEDFDFAAPAYRPGMGVAYTKAAGEGFETGVVHFVEVADCTVRNRPDAAEGAVDVAVHLAPEGAVGVGFVEILDDDDFWAGDGADVGAVLFPSCRVVLRVLCIAGLYDTGHGIANHRSHVWHEIVGFLEVEGVEGGVVLGGLFPAVVDRGGIPAFKLEEFGVGQSFHCLHIAMPRTQAAS